MASMEVSLVSPPSEEMPWAKCLLGCELPAGGEIHFLPCLHVLCSNACLDKCTADMDKEESKPHCRKCLRKFTLDQMKRNVKLEHFFEKKPKLEEMTALKCESCIMDDPVESYCIECQLNLCIACTAFHPRLRGKHDHQLDKDLEKRRLMEFEAQKKSRKECEAHGKKDINHYCYTCQLKMCDDCKPDHDKSHTVVKVEEEMKAIRARMNSTKEVQGIVNLGISKLEEKLMSLKDAEWNEFVSSLDNIMLRVLEMLQQRREALLVDGRGRHEMKVKDMENKIKVLNRAKHDSSAFLKVFNEFCDKMDLDDIGMINVARTTLPHTDALSSVKKMLQENFDEFVEKDWHVVVINDGNLFSDLQKLFLQFKLASIPGPGSSSAKVNHVGTSMTTTTTPSNEISCKDSIKESATPNQPRRIATKSTSGRLNGRPLGMPHLNKRYPTPPATASSHTNGLALPIPPLVSRETPPLRTYLSPNQKAIYGHSANKQEQDVGCGSQLLNQNQRKENSSLKQDQAPPLSSSPRSNKRLSASGNGKKGDEEASPLSGKQEKPSLLTRKKQEGDDMKKGDDDDDDATPKLKVNCDAYDDLIVLDLEPQKASKTGNNASEEDEQMVVDLDVSRKKFDGNFSDSNVTEIISFSAPSLSEEKDNGLEPKEADDEMPASSQSGNGPAENEVDDELFVKEAISREKSSPSTSSTSTLSEPSPHSSDRSKGVRKGERTRRPKVFEDYVDPETVRSPKKNDFMVDDDYDIPPPKIVRRRRVISTKKDKTPKRARLQNQGEMDSDNVIDNNDASKKNDLIADDDYDIPSPEIVRRRRERLRKKPKKDKTSKRARLQNQGEMDSDNLNDSNDASSKVTSIDNDHPQTGGEGESGFGNESMSESKCRRSLRNRQKENNAGGGSTSRKASETNPSATDTADFLPFLDVPVDSFDSKPGWCDYPIQGKCDDDGDAMIKKSDDDDDEHTNDDYCAICLDGGEEIVVCCDFCPKVFHLKCHIPIVAEDNDNDEKWRCNYDKPKEMIMEEIQSMPDDVPDSEEKPLTDANTRQFTLACKFLMEVYKIPEIPTMKWVFPEEYYEQFKYVPCHLKFIREKLCLQVETGQQPFSGVQEYMLAFWQMFLQAFQVYTTTNENRKPAVNCLRKFQLLVKDYYPEYEDVFENILIEYC